MRTRLVLRPRRLWWARKPQAPQRLHWALILDGVSGAQRPAADGCRAEDIGVRPETHASMPPQLAQAARSQQAGLNRPSVSMPIRGRNRAQPPGSIRRATRRRPNPPAPPGTAAEMPDPAQRTCINHRISLSPCVRQSTSASVFTDFGPHGSLLSEFGNSVTGTGPGVGTGYGRGEGSGLGIGSGSLFASVARLENPKMPTSTRHSESRA